MPPRKIVSAVGVVVDYLICILERTRTGSAGMCPTPSYDVRDAGLIREGEDGRFGDAVGSANSMPTSQRLWWALWAVQMLSRGD